MPSVLRTRGTGNKLEYGKFPLSTSVHFCAVWVTGHRQPGGCGVSCLEISKSCLDVVLRTLLWVSLLEWGWTEWTQKSLP